MLKEGLELMLVGMAVVFAFLTLLVFAISLASRVLSRFPDDEPEQAAVPSPSANRSGPGAPSQALVAAAVAAARRVRDQAS